jgi:bis(5'-nucleosidyl)-tetraphosphatase
LVEHSFGIIPLKNTSEGVEVLLVKHASGDHWGFPKGHQERDVNSIEVAKRELLEETNLLVDYFLSLSPFTEEYTFHHKEKGEVNKIVEYYLAFVEGELKIDHNEIIEARFVPIEQALNLATHDQTKEVCKKAIIYLLKNYFGG